jgi:hypothetical protein
MVRFCGPAVTATDDDGMRDVYVREVTVADPVPTALQISVSSSTAEPGDTVTVGGWLVRADDPAAPRRRGVGCSQPLTTPFFTVPAPTMPSS